MIWPVGTVWDDNDRLPVPHNDPALEWMADLLLDPRDPVERVAPATPVRLSHSFRHTTDAEAA